MTAASYGPAERKSVGNGPLRDKLTVPNLTNPPEGVEGPTPLRRSTPHAQINEARAMAAQAVKTRSTKEQSAPKTDAKMQKYLDKAVDVLEKFGVKGK